jgi:hypothetical protein
MNRAVHVTKPVVPTANRIVNHEAPPAAWAGFSNQIRKMANCPSVITQATVAWSFRAEVRLRVRAAPDSISVRML